MSICVASVCGVQAPKHVVCSWGMILVIQGGGLVTCLKEKDLTAKLELLYNKSLYLLALNLAQSQQVKIQLEGLGFGVSPRVTPRHLWKLPRRTTVSLLHLERKQSAQIGEECASRARTYMLARHTGVSNQ